MCVCEDDVNARASVQLHHYQLSHIIGRTMLLHRTLWSWILCIIYLIFVTCIILILWMSDVYLTPREHFFHNIVARLYISMRWDDNVRCTRPTRWVWLYRYSVSSLKPLSFGLPIPSQPDSDLLLLKATSFVEYHQIPISKAGKITETLLIWFNKHLINI